MGHSGAYEGSGGRAWGAARQHAGDYADSPTDSNAAELLDAIADALDWDVDVDEDQSVPPPTVPEPSIARPRGGRGGGGDGPGGFGGAPAGSTRGGTGGSRTRSRARAAYIGGSVATAGLAARNRDEAALREFGLTLSELDGLDVFDQANLILEAIGASLGDVQEDEINRASAAALLSLLGDVNTSAADIVRLFVVEYVFEISLTEIGDEFRNGQRDGFTTVDEEDKLRDLIQARVDQIDLPPNLTGPQIQQAIYEALDDARTFLRVEK